MAYQYIPTSHIPTWWEYVIMMKGWNMIQSHSHHHLYGWEFWGKVMVQLVPNLFSLCQNQLPFRKHFCSLQTEVQLSFNFGKASSTKIAKFKCKLNTKLTHVFSAISPLGWQEISKRTCFSMVEQSPTVATSVTTQPSVLLSWKATCWFTVDKSLSIANNAATPAHKLVTSRHTFGHIQEESLSNAHSVNSPAQQRVTWKGTC